MCLGFIRFRFLGFMFFLVKFRMFRFIFCGSIVQHWGRRLGVEGAGFGDLGIEG